LDPTGNNKNQLSMFSKNTGIHIGTPNGTLFVHHILKLFSKPLEEISIVLFFFKQKTLWKKLP